VSGRFLCDSIIIVGEVVRKTSLSQEWQFKVFDCLCVRARACVYAPYGDTKGRNMWRFIRADIIFVVLGSCAKTRLIYLQKHNGMSSLQNDFLLFSCFPTFP